VNWRIIAVHVLLPQEGGWYPLRWVPADPGRPQAGGRFTHMGGDFAGANRLMFIACATMEQPVQ
jgi:hypothetical protein